MAFDKPNYTQAPNLFFDEYLPKITSLAELKVTLIVLRNTIGWHEKEAQMDIPDLIGATGLSRQSVVDGIRLAMERGTVKRRRIGHSFSYEANIKRVKKVDSLTVNNSAQKVDSSEDESLLQKKETHKGAREETAQEPEPNTVPCPPQSKTIKKRGNGAARSPKEPPPETFLFPARVKATPELLEFAAAHGYEGEELHNSIESMRIKRLRDSKQYRDERELALDIQYWIMNCASNRDKRANANGGQW